MNLPDCRIWTLNDKVIDEIVDEYIDYVTNPYSHHRQTKKWMGKNWINKNQLPEKRALKYDETYFAEKEYGKDNLPEKIYNLPKPQRNKIRPHFVSLIHQMYLRYTSSETGDFLLNSEMLQSIYKYYNFMLETLCFESIIQKHRESVGEFARNFYILNNPKEFKYVICKNKIVGEDLDKFKSEFNKLHVKEIEHAKKITSDNYIDNYNKSLKCYKINEVDALEFIKNKKFVKEHSKPYYENIVDKISNNKIKEIDKADDNGRIYHIVTQTPRSLRLFTNIKLIIDAKNSHPLLFNYLILEFYFNYESINIFNNTYVKNNCNTYEDNNRKTYVDNNSNLYIRISNFIFFNYHVDINNHYFRKELCKHLKDNGVGNDKIAIVEKIKSDVWLYLYSTSKGRLWDEINEANPNFTREEIKVEMFSSLFYSYAKNISKEKIYAKAFQMKYPDVAGIIRQYKIKFQNQCKEQKLVFNKNGRDKDKIQLAHKLMQLESYIFTEILTRLYRKRSFRGVAIHDAIAVLDTSTNPEDVKKTMEKVYSEIGLCPTFSIDKSDSDCGTIYSNSESIE